MPKIAAFAHRLDPLFLPSRAGSNSLTLLVPEGHAWLTEVTNGRPRLFFKVKSGFPLEDRADEDILRNSDVADVLKKARISHLMVSHRGSKPLADWAVRSKISLFGPKTELQICYENKLFFDEKARELGIPVPDGGILQRGSAPSSFPCVIQDPASFGSFGTTIVKDQASWRTLQRKKKPQSRVLARRFITGQTYGITAYVDAERIRLSAIRQQCFFDDSLVFAGIQWCPTSEFSKSVITTLNDACKRLATDLQHQGYSGFANYDFMLSRGKVYFLECNPRLSSATPQLFYRHDLSGGDDFAALYLSKGQVGARTSRPFRGIPRSRYDGALIDVPFQGIIPDAGTIDPYEDGILYYQHCIPRRIEFGHQIATVLTDFPLFDVRGRLNPLAREIVSLHST